jgi:hypothetical protein
MAIITRVAKVNLVARKSKTGWSSMASFMSTNPAPQKMATKISDSTAQEVLVIIHKRIHALSLRPDLNQNLKVFSFSEMIHLPFTSALTSI